MCKISMGNSVILRQCLTLVVIFSSLIVNSTTGSGHSGEEDGSIAASDSSRIMTVVAEPLSSPSGHSFKKHAPTGQYSSSYYGSPVILDPESSDTDYFNSPSAQSQAQAHPSYSHQLGSANFKSKNTRPGRQLGLNSLSSSLNPTNLLALASGYSDTASDYGDNAAAAAGGVGGGSYSYGQPYYGHGGGYFAGWKSEVPVNYSAVGLLGFLALLSIIQNVLRQMTTTTAKPKRRRRSLSHDDSSHVSPSAHGSIQSVSNGNDNEDYTTELNRVTTLILPLLTAVAHARDGLVPFECTHRHICEANRKLTKQLGARGRSLASTLTDAVADMLTKEPGQTNRKNVRMEFSKNYLQEKLIRSAGKIGRNGENCEDFYKFCEQLQKLPTYTLPPSMFQSGY